MYRAEDMEIASEAYEGRTGSQLQSFSVVDGGGDIRVDEDLLTPGTRIEAQEVDEETDEAEDPERGHQA